MTLPGDTDSATGGCRQRLAFISYCFDEEKLAAKVCNYLESAGISCWRAQRDNRAARKYKDAITETIDDCDCVVLVLTKQANQAPKVEAEIDYADEAAKPIFTLQIGDFDLKNSLKLTIGALHRIEVRKSADLQTALAKLASDIIGQEYRPDTPSPPRKWIFPATALGILSAGGLFFVAANPPRFGTDDNQSTQAASTPSPATAVAKKSDSDEPPVATENSKASVVPAARDHSTTPTRSRGARTQEKDSAQANKAGLPPGKPLVAVPVETTRPTQPAATVGHTAPAYSVEMIQRRVRVKRRPGVLDDSFAALNTGDIVHVLSFDSSRWKKIALDHDRVGYIPKDAAKPLN